MHENYRYTAGWKTVWNSRKKSQRTGTPEKHLKKKLFLLIQIVPISICFGLVSQSVFGFAHFINGQFLWKGVFCGKFHSVEKMTFGKNKTHSCDLKKQKIPHIKKSTFPFQHPETGTLASINFSILMQGQSLAVISSFIYVCTWYVTAVCPGCCLAKCHTGKVFGPSVACVGWRHT